MHILERLAISLAAASISMAALSAPPDSVTGPPPISVDTFVTNDASTPIPVAGDVNASVSGAVDVTSVPSSLTDQLDTLIEEVQALTEEVTAIDTQPTPANFQEGYLNVFGGALDGDWHFSLDQPVYATSLVISAENDSGRLLICNQAPEGERCGVDNRWNMILGNADKEWPPITVISLPQPMKVHSFTFTCANLAETCEVSISIVGTVAE